MRQRATDPEAAGGSVPKRRGRLLLGLALLCAGCADSPLLDMLGGGAGLPPSGTEAGPVRRATGEGKAWPNLASVPNRPKEFSTPAEREALRRRLEQDRATAREEAAGPAEAPAASSRATSLPDMTGETPPPADRLEIPEAPPVVPGGPA